MTKTFDVGDTVATIEGRNERRPRVQDWYVLSVGAEQVALIPALLRSTDRLHFPDVRKIAFYRRDEVYADWSEAYAEADRIAREKR